MIGGVWVRIGGDGVIEGVGSEEENGENGRN